ncbi:hypothetical protein SAMN04488691_11053 [Haloferax larsenii]|uniref:Uncharacterized protein n=1 Tax=Haloferax larsenii TaxID=302484 RepID=A0A1H7TUA7_HALLR|nr:hypothetical protein SAMN04488691_11053 [Haloferax larsenii]
MDSDKNIPKEIEKYDDDVGQRPALPRPEEVNTVDRNGSTEGGVEKVRSWLANNDIVVAGGAGFVTLVIVMTVVVWGPSIQVVSQAAVIGGTTYSLTAGGARRYVRGQKQEKRKRQEGNETVLRLMNELEEVEEDVDTLQDITQSLDSENVTLDSVLKNQVSTPEYLLIIFGYQKAPEAIVVVRSNYSLLELKVAQEQYQSLLLARQVCRRIGYSELLEAVSSTPQPGLAPASTKEASRMRGRHGPPGPRRPTPESTAHHLAPRASHLQILYIVLK